MLAPAIRTELEETFLHAFRAAGFSRAIEAVAGAALLRASWKPRARKVPEVVVHPALRIVCEHYGVTPAAFLAVDTLIGTTSPRRREAAYRRFVACWVLRACGVSYLQIERLMGLDHSTCHYGVGVVQKKPELLEVAKGLLIKLEQKEAA